jgi:hypothetical protein
MDFIQRVILIVTILLSSLLSNTAYAYIDDPADVQGWLYSGNTSLYPSAIEACNAKLVASGLTQYTAILSSTAVQTSYSCLFTHNNSSFTTVAVQATCPLNALTKTTMNGIYICRYADCVAPQVFDTQTNTCGSPPPPPCNAGDVVSSGFYDMGKDPNAVFPATACENGCNVVFDGISPATQSEQGDGMHYYAKGDYTKSGLTCSSGSPSPSAFPKTPPSVDEQARAEAEANAKAAAAAKAAADAAAAADKAAADKAAAAAAASDAYAKKVAADKAAAAAKAAADAAATAAALAAATAADPNSTQAEKDSTAAASTAAAAAASTAAAAETTATQTASTAAGAAAATAKDDAPEKQKDFCETNSHLQVCKNSSINDGFCSNGQLTGFSCSGDAVNCNQAETLARQYCATTQTDTSLIQKYNEALNDNGSLNPASLQNRTIINLPTSLDASSPFSASCNEDITISVGSSTVTLPFSAWCGVLENLGYLFLACAYITAALILGGAV